MYFFWPCTTIFTSYFACTLTLIFCSSSALFSTFFPKIFFRECAISLTLICVLHTRTHKCKFHHQSRRWRRVRKVSGHYRRFLFLDVDLVGEGKGKSTFHPIHPSLACFGFGFSEEKKSDAATSIILWCTHKTPHPSSVQRWGSFGKLSRFDFISILLYNIW